MYKLPHFIMIAAFCTLGCSKADPKGGEGNADSLGSVSTKETTEAKISLEADRSDNGSAPKKITPGKAGNEPTPASSSVVLAEGVATSADQSLKDAFRNAVRQVVGAVVDAETLVKNDEIISDKVLTYSAGFVTSYDEISKTHDNGLFRTTIRATVERRNVIAKLKASNIAAKDVDGKGLFAEVVTQLDAEKDAKLLLANALVGFPLNVMEAEVVGKAEVIDRNATNVKLAIGIRFSVNQKAFDVFSRRLCSVLESIAKEKDTFGLALGRHPKVPGKCMVGASNKDTDVFSRFSKRQVVLALNTQATQTRDRSEWACFVLDQDWAQPLEACNRQLTAKLSILGMDGRIITVDRFSALIANGRNTLEAIPIRSKRNAGFSYFLGREKNNLFAAKKEFWLSPFFIRANPNYQFNPYNHNRTDADVVEFRDEVVVRRTITITLDELKTLEGVKCELSQ